MDIRAGESADQGGPKVPAPRSELAGMLRDDGSVVVPASVAGDVLRLLVLGLDARVRKDGGEVAPRARALLLELHRAAQTYEDVRELTSGFASETSPAEPETVEVTVSEMARVMHASEQYVRRLCKQDVLPARRVGPVWLITIERQRLEQDE